MGFYETYTWLFTDNADSRVQNWFLMRDPLNLVLIMIGYLLLNKVILPAYMKNRKPYDLKTIIKYYNIFEIIANTYVTYGIITSGWTTTYHWGCLLPDYSDDPMSLRMLDFFYYTLLLKLTELVETSFFILRKKDNQASFLHVYHHVCSLWIIWTATKYVGGGMASVTPLLNNSIHIIMYSYYLAASEGGPKLRAWLTRWKKWLTILQMLQFTVMLIHSMQVFKPSCPAPTGIMWIYIPNVIGVYYLFYDFFKKTYVSDSKQNGNTNKKDQ